VDPATGASSATVFAMYHPAAALRTPAIERESYADIAGVPMALLDSRRRREEAAPAVPGVVALGAAEPGAVEPGPVTIEGVGFETVEAPDDLDVVLDAPVLAADDAAEPQLTLF
jgi:hypothetical protein